MIDDEGRTHFVGDDCDPPHTNPLFPDGRPEWFCGYAIKRLPDEGEDIWLSVIPLTFGRARLCVCDPGDASIEHWCMDSSEQAIAAWQAWPERPTKWNRHQDRHGHLEWPH